ncbi:Serologically defined colon cancer antigen 8 [Fukomys damarensis]|uniref:Serologically defined colon cancer antigen 8 n=1 Tax=Fukomys damarensis TaxID=885580 RepID=A0A091D5A6_FUKDA|nr:Serologically defined colon cancer antigen 8 [Fukomys damarensis]
MRLVQHTWELPLRQLDKHSQATAQQLAQLLNRQSQLLLERQSLSEEVDRLRAQFGNTQAHVWQPASPGHALETRARTVLVCCGPAFAEGAPAPAPKLEAGPLACSRFRLN